MNKVSAISQFWRLFRFAYTLHVVSLLYLSLSDLVVLLF